jgi:hypothetical protein
MIAARSRSSSPLAHRWMATRSTVMPASAARLAFGSPTPRSRRAAARRGARHPGHDPLLEEGRPTEEHFAFVGEVSEEGALGQPGSGGDLGGRGPVESPL